MIEELLVTMNLVSASCAALGLVAAIAAPAASPGPLNATAARSVLFFVLGAAYVAACRHLAGGRS